MLLRPVRMTMSRIMLIDPDNFVHKIALCILMLIVLTSFTPLIVLGGRPPLLTVVSDSSSQGNDLGLSTGPFDLFYQLMWTIPAVLVAAGWPIARKLREALVRLGLVRPTAQQVAAGVALGVGLAFAAGGLNAAIHQLWVAMGWPTTNTEAFGQILSGLITLSAQSSLG